MAERGSATPLFMLLLIGGTLLLVIALDLGRLAASWREAAAAADAGAEAGAARIDPAAAYRGDLRLDPAAAVRAAEDAAIAFRPRAGREITATAGPHRVCVTVRRRFRPLAPGFVPAPTIEVTACAVPRRG